MTETRKLFFLANIAVFLFVIYLLRPVLTPFLIAMLLCYLCDPLVERTAERMGRTSSVVLLLFCLLTVFIVALLTIIPIFQKQFAALIGALPASVEYLNEQLIPQIEKLLFLQPGAIDASLIKTAVTDHLEQLNQVAKSLLSFVTTSGLSFFSLLMNLLLVPLVMFYLLRDWPDFIAHIRQAIPEKNKQVALMLTSRCDEVLGAFIRGQLVVMLVLGLFYGFGLTLVGLQMGLLIGFIAGLLSIVPYLGFLGGFLISAILAYFQFGGCGPIGLVFVVFIIGQLLEGFVLTPILVGDKIGLHPVAVIFAILAGGQLFGLVGTLLALPAAAVIKVLLAYGYQQYLQSTLYTGN